MVVETKDQLKYQTLAHRLEGEIQSGRLKPGQAVPSIRKLMQKGRLSMATVVRGLEVLERKGLVHRMSNRGYFVADRHRPDPTLGQIAFVTPALAEDTREFVKGLTQAIAPQEHLTLATYSANADLELYQSLISRVARMRPTGAVVTSMPPEIMNVRVDSLVEQRVPLVTIGQKLPDFPCDRVDYRGGQSARKLLPYLLERKARDVIFFIVNPLSDPSRQEMVQVFREGFAEAGVPIPDDRVFSFDAPHGFAAHADPCIDSQRVMEGILKRGISFKTVICCHDYPAVGALRAILRAGLRVPQDVKVVSCARCGVESASPMKLTTVNANREDQAKVAGELLLRRIGGYEGPPEVHYVSGDLIGGETA